MATKSLNKIHTTPLRAPQGQSYRTRAQLPRCEVSLSVLDSCSSDINHHSSVLNEDQLKPKMDKESTSPPNNNPLPLITSLDQSRPLTRSSSTASLPLPSCLPFVPLPPLSHRPTHDRTSEELQGKKLSKAVSWQQLSDEQCDNQAARRSCTKLMDTVLSPYSEVRKSYRKMNKKEILSVPYRKCHDAMEGRIVTLINKLVSAKNCAKDIENLIQKMGRMSGRDMVNRYVIAGISSIIAIAGDGNQMGVKVSFMEGRVLLRLKEEQKKLQARIANELDSFEEYQGEVNANCDFEIKEFRGRVIRRMYKLMKERHPGQARSELRRKVMVECEGLFAGQASVSQMVRLMRTSAE